MKRPLLVLGLLLGSPSYAAAAPTKEACIGAFDQAQQARRGGRFGQAREQLLVCSQSACPSVVRADCADVLRQVEAAQPTIVLKASDARGVDLTDVSVELNGQKLASSLDGRAIPVDPGKLTLVFHRAPWKPVPLEAVIAEGEKGRILQATLGPPLPPPEKRGEPAGPPAPAPAPLPRRSVVGWAVPAGLGVVSVAAFAFAGITRVGVGNEADDARASCAPTCSQSDRAHWSSELVRTNVLLGVGIGTAALTALSWFLLAPKHGARASAALPAPTPSW